MTTKNDITGDPIVSKPSNDRYREGWDKIFKPKDNKQTDEKTEKKWENKYYGVKSGVHKLL